MPISEQILHPTPVEEPTQVPAAAPVQVPAAPAPEPAPTVVVSMQQGAEPVTLAPEPLLAAPVEAAPEDDVTLGCLVLRAGTCAWRATKCALQVLDGLRTLLFFGVSGALVVLAKFTDTNVAEFISKMVHGKVTPEDLLLFMTVAGMVLRFITTTPVFARWQKAAKGGIVSSEQNMDEGD